MKVLVNILIFISLINCSFSQKDTTNKEHKSEIMFAKTIHNFGKLNFGDESVYLFEFKNIGKSPLVIQKIETSCGCTVAEKPEQPLRYKEKGYITVVYEADETGKFQKSIKIYSNAVNSPFVVYIKGVVQPQTNN